MRLVAIVILMSVLSLVAKSQDLTGVWTGHISTSGNELPYELVISRDGDKLTGYSMTLFSIDGVENMGIKTVKLKAKNGKLTIEDDELIGDTYSTKAKRMMLYSTLYVSTRDTMIALSGTFNSRSYGEAGYKGTVLLYKRTGVPPTKLIAQLTKLNLLQDLSFVRPVKEKDIIVSSSTAVKNPEPAKGNQFAVPPPTVSKSNQKEPVVSKPVEEPAITAKKIEKPTVVQAKPIKQAAAELKTRKVETIRTISYAADSLLLTLYDNGQVDGDTVSVVWNGQTVIAREGLTAKPIKKTIYTRDILADSVQLVMYAENLGSIPPNTGLLIVEDGEKRYEIRFSADLQRNSAIIFRKQR